MIGLLALVALAQGGLEVTASVDRVRLPAGGEVTLTVRARTRRPDPVELVLPSIIGLAVTGSREGTELSLSGGGPPVRLTTRELTLRAERPGRIVIGPVVARQGSDRVQTAPITLQIDSATARGAAALGPRARAILERSPPPAGDRVTVHTLVSHDTALVGEQLDVVVVAWFPRGVRDRLRRPPVLSLPAGAGAWVLPQPVPAGIVTSHRGSSGWLDAFVLHHVLFPLATGRVIVPPAAVSYALPLSFSFFSREERLTVTADSFTVVVEPPPAPGGGGPAPTAVGESIALEIALSGTQTRVGEPIEVAVQVSGIGNVPLWGEPRLEWPPGFRTYPAGTTEYIEMRDGRLAGRKTYRAVVVPDSIGRFVLPDVRYPYYDVAVGRVAIAVAPPRPVVVAPAVGARTARVPPPLHPAPSRAALDRFAAGVAPLGWAVVFAVPPLVVALVHWRRTRGPTARPERPADRRPGGLAKLEREFDATLTDLVPDDRTRYGTGLAAALRAAGIAGATADHVVRVRDRLRAARYGPGGTGDERALTAELERVIASLGGRPQRAARRGRVGVATGLLVAAMAGPAAAQERALTAEQLYEAGALRAASDSFAARAAASPGVAAHWYNLGAALYVAGADGKAAAAWALAARRAPRDGLIRGARRLLPAPDDESGRLVAAGPLTVIEWALLGAVAWLGLWIAIAGRMRRLGIALGILVAGCAVGGAREWRRTARPLAVVLESTTPVRAAPHGAAAATATLEAGAAVLAGRRYGHWIEVRRADGIHGWILERQVVRL